ncbi:LCP family protein [Actinomadura graeca]|uniref:LCP family protein n=1 Tax=Actinomadura graeca TaxID=2750812 RepID=A0ABX8R7X6_9ACTN|nr:LCP family protein [Actinomadura graeca]QXJ26077.1 LCP family protein [Actinomadura graeca]
MVGAGTGADPLRRAAETVYQYGLAHHDLLADGARPPDRGAELLKRTVGHILGGPGPYYVMVDMRSFRKLVDAVGGVRICVGTPVPAPRRQVPGGVIGPGRRQLGGREALWYGRSRTSGSDYDRMRRQKCLLWALARQSGPVTVLRGFERLTRVFKDSVGSDVPRGLLPPLVGLAGRVRGAQVTSLPFVPPVIAPRRPDFPRIRRLAGHAVREAGSPSPRVPGLHILGRSCT